MKKKYKVKIYKGNKILSFFNCSGNSKKEIIDKLSLIFNPKDVEIKISLS